MRRCEEETRDGGRLRNVAPLTGQGIVVAGRCDVSRDSTASLPIPCPLPLSFLPLQRSARVSRRSKIDIHLGRLAASITQHLPLARGTPVQEAQLARRATTSFERLSEGRFAENEQHQPWPSSSPSAASAVSSRARKTRYRRPIELIDLKPRALSHCVCVYNVIF